jgi:hypothetical protein
VRRVAAAGELTTENTQSSKRTVPGPQPTADRTESTVVLAKRLIELPMAPAGAPVIVKKARRDKVRAHVAFSCTIKTWIASDT